MNIVGIIMNMLLHAQLTRLCPMHVKGKEDSDHGGIQCECGATFLAVLLCRLPLRTLDASYSSGSRSYYTCS